MLVKPFDTLVAAMNNGQSLDTLRRELSELFEYIQEVRQEIAAIHNPADEEHHLDKVGDELQAIVDATERSTFAIMDAMDKNEELVSKLRAVIKDPDQLALLDGISQNGNTVFEACTFQDITGQRVGKVVTTFTYLEDRVNALCRIWGKSALDAVEVKPVKEKTENEKLLHGPQLEGEGISQEDIDKMFS